MTINAVAVTMQLSGGQLSPIFINEVLVAGAGSYLYTEQGTATTEPNLIPDQFTFIDQSNVPLSRRAISAPITISGLTDGFSTLASISGAATSEYRINGGAWITADASVNNGNTIEVSHTSSASGNFDTNTTLALGPLGQVQDTFTSTTLAVSAEYRTVIKFGDTQQYPYANTGGQAMFTAMIDWIIDNKYTYNIDFVMFPGDVIDLGTGTPVDSPNGPLFPPQSTPTLLDVEPQWTFMNAQIARLEPGGDPNNPLGIPYVICRGNHDNTGLQANIDANLDVLGFPHYYSDAHFDGLETAFVNAGSDRLFEHETGGALKAGVSPASSLSHVFRVRIGDTVVRVIAPTYPHSVLLGDNIDNEVSWAADRCGEHQSIPARLLTHWYGTGTPALKPTVVDQMATVAPQLFASDEGHRGGLSTTMATVLIGGDAEHEILEATTDFSNVGGTGTPSAELVRERYYLDENGNVDELEVDIYDVQGDSTRLGAGEFITRQPFVISSPVPYDLTGFNIGHTVTWPIPPTTTQVINVPADMSFNAATATSGAQIIVAAGSYAGRTSGWGNDIDIIMDNDATVTEINFGSAQRIRWTGGNVTVGVSANGCTDILFDNVNVDARGGNNSAANWAAVQGNFRKLALVNSTFHSTGIPVSIQGTGWGTYVRPVPDWAAGPRHQDIIIANCRSEVDEYQGARFNSLDRAVIVDSIFLGSEPEQQAGLRFHHICDTVFMENVLTRGHVLIQTDEVTGDLLNADINNMHVYTWVNGLMFLQVGNLGQVPNTGTVANSTTHATVGAGVPLGISPLTDAGGNTRVAWDGTTATIDWTQGGALASKTQLSNYGADH